MNGTVLLQALMSAPVPGTHASVAMTGVAGEMPIHDRRHLRMAISRWGRYRFPSSSARRQAADQIVQRAIKLSLVTEGIKLLKG